MNDIIKRTLNTAGLPAILEPVGLDSADGKRPDGITVFPFSQGKSLVWDATCSDTFCQTSLLDSALNPGSAANKAEERKMRYYQSLQDRHRFVPVSIETSGTYGTETAKFIAELGKRMTSITGEKRETEWLRQRLSVAIVQGNATSVLSTGSNS